jgi:NAD(P)H-dependent FMN reductase
MRYIRKHFPDNTYNTVNIAQKIHRIEKDHTVFEEIIEKVRSADLVFWAAPLYIMLVCSQYKRFIELVWERGATEAFKNTYAAVLTTSINFYDVICINYLRSICEDFGMRFTEAYSAAMRDLHIEEERKRLRVFAGLVFNIAEQKCFTTQKYRPLPVERHEYQPDEEWAAASVCEGSVDVDREKDKVVQCSPEASNALNEQKVVIIHDAAEHETNTRRMIDVFNRAIGEIADIVNLRKLDWKGGCLECGPDYQCAYTGKDEFIDFYNNTVTHFPQVKNRVLLNYYASNYLLCKEL